jgi:type VI secretion system secreted protein VgrG
MQAPAPGNEAQFRFECSALAPETFLIHAFTGEEAISRPFRFDLDLVSTDPDVLAADVVGKPATLTLAGRKVHGTVSDFQLSERAAGYYGYRVTLVPRLWVLSLYFQSRIYQKYGAEGILKKVFEAAGLTGSDYRFELTESYAQAEYVSQYQETDLAFVSRLMEHRGIFYYFWHDERDELVVADDSREAPGRDREPVPYNPAASLNPAHDWAIHVFTEHERLVPGQVVVKDYNYRTPETPLVGQTESRGYAPAVRYEYGGHCKNQREADWLARVRSEEIECGRRVFEGESNYPLIQPGFALTLDGHYRDRLNADYLVTGVRHTGSYRGAINALAAAYESAEATYTSRFTCIPLGVRYRPARLTPIPKMPGVSTARVETPGGKYAHVDEEGRYKVKMAYDRSDETDGEASRPIRMSQPYSGAGYGMHFPNHAGTELMVAHMNDDPDRPIALGTVPNPSNASPVSAENKEQSVIRTQGGNELILDDTDGEQQVRLASSANNVLLLDDKGQRILISTTKGNQVLLSDQSRRVFLVTTDGHTLSLDDELQAIAIQSKGGHLVQIDDAAQKIIVKDSGGNQSLTIDIGGGTITIENVTGDIKLKAPAGTVAIEAKELDVQVSSNSSTTVGGSATTTIGGNETHTTGGNFKTKANNILHEASGQLKQKAEIVNSQAKAIHRTKAGIVTSQAEGLNRVKGELVTLSASTMVEVKGPAVKLN